MKKIKVTIVDKGINKIDSLRGIGVHTNELLKELKLIDELDVKVNSNDKEKSDIYHYPKFNPYVVNLPFSKRGKIVLTIHDLIPLIYKNNYPSGLRGKFKFLLNKLLLNNVDKIITISNTSKKDIIRILNINHNKISVTYLAAKENFKKIIEEEKLVAVTKKYNLPKKFVLYVGDVNYNKNLFILAKACKKINIPLVIIGKQAAELNIPNNNVENKPFIDFIKEFGKDKDIIRLGFVDDENIASVYNLATVYCQPSLYEGFSLPILEALNCGVPVVASKIQTHEEIFGDSVLYFDKNDYLDLAEKLNKVINDNNLRNELIEKGFQAIKKYSWKKTAKETLSVYKSLL
jgi:glycosyltransferase involved in cell wall biosynthesis